MSNKFWVVWLLLVAGALAFGQALPVPGPQMSTADRVAIQAFEKQKTEAQRAYNEAMQGEGQVVREWATAHPGWHLDPATFQPAIDHETTGGKIPEGTKAIPVPATGPKTGPLPEVKK